LNQKPATHNQQNPQAKKAEIPGKLISSGFDMVNLKKVVINDAFNQVE